MKQSRIFCGFMSKVNIFFLRGIKHKIMFLKTSVDQDTQKFPLDLD